MMIKIITTLIITVLVFLTPATPGYADSNNEVPTNPPWTKVVWKNQYDSTLNIKQINNDGKLTGTFINRAEGYPCQNIPYPITGWVYDNVISFTTKWENVEESCHSITSWTGFFDSNSFRILTKWNLVDNQGHLKEGTDIFNGQKTKINESLLTEESNPILLEELIQE
jgi:hypothetical protein